MAKFKKGDRVRCFDQTKYVKKDATGTVDEDNSGIPYVIWDNENMLNEQTLGNNRCVTEDYLELIDEPTTDDIGTLFEQYKVKKAELQVLKNKIIELL